MSPNVNSDASILVLGVWVAIKPPLLVFEFQPLIYVILINQVLVVTDNSALSLAIVRLVYFIVIGSINTGLNTI